MSADVVRYIGGPFDGSIREFPGQVQRRLEVPEMSPISSVWDPSDMATPKAQAWEQRSSFYEVYKSYRRWNSPFIAIHETVPHRKIGVNENPIGLPPFVTQGNAGEYLKSKLTGWCSEIQPDGYWYELLDDTFLAVFEEHTRMLRAEGIAVARTFGPDKKLATYTPWFERLEKLLEAVAEKQWSARKQAAAHAFMRELDLGRDWESAARNAAREAGID